MTTPTIAMIADAIMRDAIDNRDDMIESFNSMNASIDQFIDSIIHEFADDFDLIDESFDDAELIESMIDDQFDAIAIAIRDRIIALIN